MFAKTATSQFVRKIPSRPSLFAKKDKPSVAGAKKKTPPIEQVACFCAAPGCAHAEHECEPVCACGCLHVCIHMHACVHTRMEWYGRDARMRMCACVCVHMCICAWSVMVGIHTCVCTPCMHANMHAYAHGVVWSGYSACTTLMYICVLASSVFAEVGYGRH